MRSLQRSLSLLDSEGDGPKGSVVEMVNLGIQGELRGHRGSR